jgi:hypothetical protein
VLAAAAVGVAFLAGGAVPALRTGLDVALPLGVGLATWLVPTPARVGRRVRAVERWALAAACAALVAVVGPVEHAYRAAAQGRLHGDEGSRRAAIAEILRLGRDFRGLSLAGLDLSGLDLTGADVRGVDLSHADLTGTRLWGAEVDGASFDGAKLERADLGHTALAQATQLESATCSAATQLPEGWRCADGRVARARPQ